MPKSYKKWHWSLLIQLSNFERRYFIIYFLVSEPRFRMRASLCEICGGKFALKKDFHFCTSVFPSCTMSTAFLFRWVKTAGLWRWPPTPSWRRGGEWVELYLCLLCGYLRCNGTPTPFTYAFPPGPMVMFHLSVTEAAHSLSSWQLCQTLPCTYDNLFIFRHERY